MKNFILGLDILDHIIDEIHPFYVMRSISNKLQFEIETQVAPKLSGLNLSFTKKCTWSCFVSGRCFSDFDSSTEFVLQLHQDEIAKLDNRLNKASFQTKNIFFENSILKETKKTHSKPFKVIRSKNVANQNALPRIESSSYHVC